MGLTSGAVDKTGHAYARMGSRQRAFLKAFALSANISAAARAAKMPRSLVYEWQEHDEQFVVAMQQAREEAFDRLEAEALRRAVDGVTRERPIFSRGEQVGSEVITEYSDQLLIMLLKAARPEKFRENTRVEHAGMVQVGHDPLAGLSTDELRRIASRQS